MASTSLLGLPPIPAELKGIIPYLQRAQELKKQDPIVSYWCAYYAAQIGISLKARDAASRDVLLGLLGTLEAMKTAIGPNDAIDVESVSSAYVENFALKVFASADNEDRDGHASKATAKKFLAAANFLEILKTFPKKDVSESNEEKIKYAKWKAADIAKAFREGRKPAPGPPGWSEDQELRQLQAEVRAEEAANAMLTDVPQIPSVPSSHPSSSSPPRSSPQNIPPRPHPKWKEQGDGPSETWSTAATPGLSETPSMDFGFPPTSAGSIKSSHSRGSSTSSTNTIGSRGMAVDHRSGSPPKSAIKSSSGSPDSDKRVHWSDPSSPAPPFIPPPPPHAPSSSPPGEYLGPQSIYGPPQSPHAPPLPPALPPHPPTSSSPTLAPIPPIHPAPPQGPPVYGNPVAPPQSVPIELTPALITKVQRHCRFAISSLDYEDAEQARKELRAALALLES
ncbi:Vta1 like-domain-containing protein [Panaeolus papilionaceus]|nr:Vta1 like-domain-containing protein [Panaeolus papilionaceus]